MPSAGALPQIRGCATPIAIGVAALLASQPAAAQLNYTQTDFLHGFASAPAIWTDRYSDLGNVSARDYLSGRINLGSSVGLPFFNPRTSRFANEVRLMADSIYWQNGRHVLVGHSQGALVARGTYIGLDSVGAGRVDTVRAGIAGIIAVAAPHQGAPIASNAEQAKNFFVDVERRVNDALNATKVEAGILAYVAGGFFARIGAGLFISYLDSKSVDISSVKSLPTVPALRDLDTAATAIRDLNTRTDDAAIPRANVTARFRITNAALRVAAATEGKNEDEMVRSVSNAKGLFSLCKYAGYATLVLSGQARKCAYALKVLGRIDDRWTRYTNGTERGRDIWGRSVDVPRQIPFDGLVPNERSRYPGLTDPNFDLLPVEGANHQSIYRRRDGVERIRDAMGLIGMGQPQPAPPRRGSSGPALSASISGPTTVASGSPNTWHVAVSGGTAPLQYQWSGRVSGTGASVTATLFTSGTLYVDVTDAMTRHTRVSLDVAVSGNCGSQIIC